MDSRGFFRKARRRRGAYRAYDNAALRKKTVKAIMILELTDYWARNSKEVLEYMEVLRVSANSKPKSVAGALAAVVREKGCAELQAVGAGAVNQAVKAIAIARGFVAPNGIDLVTIPAFAEITIENEERTAIKFIVEPR
jgi:stage V sporulation protein S